MGYQISKISDIGQSNVLNSDVPYCFPYISVLIFYRNGFELEALLRMSHLNWDMPKPSQMFKAREIMRKSWRYQIFLRLE